MNKNKSSTNLIVKSVILTLGIYLVFFVFNYFNALYQISHEGSVSLLSPVLFILRSIVIIFTAFLLRKKNLETVKTINPIIFIASSFLLILNLIFIISGFQNNIIGNLFFSLGIDEMSTVLIVLWEQLTSNFMIAHLFLFLIIVFFRNPKTIKVS